MGLTDLQVKKLQPGSKEYEISDGKGLSIRILPSGGKTWIFRYPFEGLPKRITLGRYPGVGLARARELHAAAMIDVQQGIDPGEKAKQAKAKRKAVPTFSDLLSEFWEKELSKTPSGAERKRLVEKDALPAWKNRKVADLTRRDAVLLIDKVRERAPVTANRLQGVLVRMLNFASERGMIEHSPLVGMRRAKEKARERVLSDEEIKLFWEAMDLENKKIDLYHVTKLALKSILLTGQRPGEVCGMRFSEIDTENKVWNLPAERTKNGEANTVPLTPLMVETIEMAGEYSGDCDFVFRSSHKEGEPVSRHAVTRAMARHWSEMGIKEAFTPHDLRRTLRTKLAELGVEDIVAEKVLGHKLQGIAAVYNRHSYDVEKRQALNQWERRLRSIAGLAVEPSANNVIQFRRIM